MRILFANDTFEVERGGGTATRTMSIAAHMQRKGFEVSVVSLSDKLSEPTLRSLNDLNTILFPIWARRFIIPKISASELRKLVQKNDVVYLSGHWSLLNIRLAVHARKLEVPYVICPAGSLEIWGRSRLLKHLFNIILGKRYVRLASELVAVTKEEVPEFIPYGVNPTRVKVIPNVFEPPQEIGENKCTGPVIAKLNIDKPYFLFLGRLNPIKGPDILLSAFLKVCNELPHSLVFAGPDGGLMKDMQAVVEERGLTKRVHFVGYVSGKVKSQILSSCDLLVIPSRKEAMSMVVLEAASYKKTVIATDQCGLDNVIRPENGITVSANIDELAASLSEITDKDLEKMGKCLFADANKLFGWSVMGPKYVSLFRGLCK